MIRPLTIATCLLACGSGLYLYQSKHEVQLLDRTIEKTVHDTSALREQSRLLAAEWTMLNDPDRLRQFSDTYLSLKSIAPSQFTSVADLDNRLPAPRPEAPTHGTDEDLAPVVAEAAPPQNVPDAAPASDGTAVATVADQDLPIPPIPSAPPAPVVASVVRPADARSADRPQVSRPAVAESQARPVTVANARPSDQLPPDQRAYDPRPSDQRAYDPRSTDQRVSDQRPPEQRPSDQRQTDPRTASRVADARPPVAAQPRPIVLATPRPQLANAPTNAPVNLQPMPYRQPMVPASAPYGGSLLGMARGSMPPAPRPTPVNAAYNSN
jgi:hypothetical protein